MIYRNNDKEASEKTLEQLYQLLVNIQLEIITQNKEDTNEKGNSIP